jgi:hypothetical protein
MLCSNIEAQQSKKKGAARKKSQEAIKSEDVGPFPISQKERPNTNQRDNQFSALSAQIAKVIKKNGQTVEGKLKDLIVQKSSVKESREGAKAKYTASYYLTNGGDITSIDENGGHKMGGLFAILSVSQKGELLNDTDVIQTAMNMPQGSIFGYTKAGGQVVRLGGLSSSEQNVETSALLGTFRVDPQTGKGMIVPYIELLNEKGTVKLLVKDIIGFSLKTKK